MNGRDAALVIMRADMATGRASKRSLGVMYAHVMAGSRCDGPDFWGPVNEAIRRYAAQNSRHEFRFLEGVKKVAWSIFDEVGRHAGISPTNALGAVASETSA